MNASSNTSSNQETSRTKLRLSGDVLVLPIEPDYRERPPSGSWLDGYHLSLRALELVAGRPEIFAERRRRICEVEFTL